MSSRSTNNLSISSHDQVKIPKKTFKKQVVEAQVKLDNIRTKEIPVKPKEV